MRLKTITVVHSYLSSEFSHEKVSGDHQVLNSNNCMSILCILNITQNTTSALGNPFIGKVHISREHHKFCNFSPYCLVLWKVLNFAPAIFTYWVNAKTTEDLSQALSCSSTSHKEQFMNTNTSQSLALPYTQYRTSPSSPLFGETSFLSSGKGWGEIHRLGTWVSNFIWLWVHPWKGLIFQDEN